MSPIPSPRRVALAAVLGAFLLSGCANILKQYYESTPASPGAALAPFTGTTQVYVSADLAIDSAGLSRNGFAQIGVVSFKTSGHVAFEEIQDLAREVGADVVVCSKISVASHRAVMPFDPVKGATSDGPNPYVHVEGSITLFSGNYGGTASAGGPGMDFKGSVTSSGIPGVSAEDMKSIDSERFEFTATFWRKTRKSPGP